MFYLFYGENTKIARQEANKLVEKLSIKKPNAGVFKMDEDSFDIDEFKYLLEAQGLFEKNYIVFLDRVLKDEEFLEVIKESIPRMKESTHIFILLEEKIQTSILKNFEKKAEKLKNFKEESKKAKEFKIFSLADALGERNKKNLWVLYQRAKREKTPPEEIYGVLFWQIKTILLSKGARSAEEAGLAPYPFKKAKSFSKNFSSEELKEISSRLVENYHLGFSNSGNIETELEKFILNF